jgi:glycosyltransferase involved in cell wall biosynthesis
MFFFESVKDLLQKNKNIKVLIIGDGNFKENIEKIKVDFKIEDQIILKKFEKNIEAYIEISDLICVPSLWEGFGLVVIEGMIKSKIVLASDVGGIPEIIENGI